MCEEKKKKKLKNLIRFHSGNKIDNYNGGGGEGKKKVQRIYRSQNIRIIKFSLSHCCQSPFPLWESQSTSPP